MAAAIRETVPGVEIELIKGGGGDFIVIADGKELWNKRAMGDRFPDNAEVTAQLSG